jgi:chromate reductase
MRILASREACGATRGTRRSCGRQPTTLPPGLELVLHEGLKAIPPFDEDDEHDPHGAVHALRRGGPRRGRAAHRHPGVQPLHAGPAQERARLAVAPAGHLALRGKPVAVVGASTGLFGAVWAQAETRKVLAAAGARPLDRELPVGQAAGAFDGEGRLADPDIAAELESILAELAATAGERALAAA